MHYKKVTIGKNLGFLFKCQLLYYMYIGYTVESFSFVGGGGGVNVRGQPNVISSVNSLVCSTTIGLTGIFATV